MFIETKYIQLMSSSLPLFVSKGNHTYNFRCPICKDSQTNKFKARGYLLFKNGKHYFYCHNCNVSLSFNKFLAEVNPVLYKEYQYEKYGKKPQRNVESLPQIIKHLSIENKILSKLPKISLLNPNHFAKQFVVKRNIPTFYHSRLYYSSDFNAFARQIDETKFQSDFAEKRLIIPMFDKQKKLIGIQGRIIKPNKKSVRYLTALCSSDNPKVFGLDLINYLERYYVFEGPIDSMFIHNSIAVCGGTIHSELQKNNVVKQNAVVVYDNEPRNKDVVRNMKKCVKQGYQIVVWPNSVKHKDINDMVLNIVPAGKFVHTEEVQKAAQHIESTMKNNTYEGLEALSKIAEWKKIL